MDVNFPHICPGKGCAVCRWERERPIRAKVPVGKRPMLCIHCEDIAKKKHVKAQYGIEIREV
jgi:hypothetical protein